MRTLLALSVLATLASAAPLPGDPGTPEHAKAGELVKQLGDAKFATREAAAKQKHDLPGFSPVHSERDSKNPPKYPMPTLRGQTDAIDREPQCGERRPEVSFSRCSR